VTDGQFTLQEKLCGHIDLKEKTENSAQKETQGVPVRHQLRCGFKEKEETIYINIQINIQLYKYINIQINI
jgi:hypothetical protein